MVDGLVSRFHVDKQWRFSNGLLSLNCIAIGDSVAIKNEFVNPGCLRSCPVADTRRENISNFVKYSAALPVTRK